MILCKVKIQSLFILFYITSFVVLPLYQNANVTAINPPPFFTISVLAPCINSEINHIATIMVEQLPKIGIGVDTFDHTTWEDFLPRTLDYPGPFPIPTHAEGGYDIAIYTRECGLDYNPYLFYSQTFHIWNFYQYLDQTMDFAIDNYSRSLDISNRITYLNEIQSILYENLPSIPIIFGKETYIHDEKLVGWDPLLWSSESISMYNWSIPNEAELHYAQTNKPNYFYCYNRSITHDAQWLNQIYSGLLTRALHTHEYIPDLALSWATTNIDPSGTNVTFELNPLVKWADNTKFNTSDVEYSYEIYRNIFNDLPYDLVYHFPNQFDITIIDEHEILFTFIACHDFHSLEQFFSLPILPKHIWESIPFENQGIQAETWALTNPSKLMGTGAYYLHAYDDNNGIIHLKLNEYFEDWSGITPAFNDIYFEYYSTKESALSAVSNGSVDVLDSSFSPTLDEIPYNTSYTLVNSGLVVEIAINNYNPYIGTGELCPISSPESGKNIRKAISYIVPRLIIINEIYDTLASPGATAFPNTAIGFNDSLEPFEYNISKAKEYMDFDNWISSTTSPQDANKQLILHYILITLGIVGVIIALILISWLIIQRKR
ncbi:MAG: hypothetical protein FK730_05545 [Asgard group archaeon]|nr:hypothetical protein [Asgard group archaeon]